MRNFFLSRQSQFRKFKEALLQSQFCNFLSYAALQLQVRNSAIAIFGIFLAEESGCFMKKKSEVKNFVLLSL
jgi:hypothetical protein